MAKRTIEQWQTLFKQHEDSGKTAAQFCRENAVCAKYFAKRKKDLGWNTDSQNKPKLMKLLKPALSHSLREVELRHRELHLHLNSDVSPEWLAQLMKSLAS